tara:strand:- start:4340 stop:5254 length:915 start_codon:yes stop_codon:yes gene_type:complete
VVGIREYSESDRTAATLSLVAFVAGISLIWAVIGPGHSAASISEASGSQVIPSTTLAMFRTIAAMASVFTLSAIASNKEGLNYNVLDYETKIYGPRRLLGTSRLAAYTMWSFGLLGIYFSIAAFVTWSHILGTNVPDILLVACPAALAASCASALLVSATVTFILIPESNERGDNISHYFLWDNQIMHNGNVIILGAELLVTDITIGLSHISFPVIFGAIYVTFSAFFAMREGGFYFYDFLDPRLNGAPVIHMILLAVLAALYIGVILLTSLVDWNRGVAAVVIILLLHLVTTFKDPKEATLDS